MDKPITCTRQGYDTLEEYRTHRQKCPRCRAEMGELKRLALAITAEQIDETDRKLEIIPA